MRKSLLGFVLAAALLPVSMVHAGVKEDLQAGKSVEEIIAQAKADGLDITSVLGEIIANAPDKAYAAVAAAIAANPSQSTQISNFAISKGLDPATVRSIASSSSGSGSGSGSGGVFGGISGVGTGISLGGFTGGGSGGGGGGSGASNN